MKYFQDFIFECYKIGFLLFEGKYSDEHAFRKVWNHFITHRKYGKEIRDLINAGKYDEAREAMEREISASREDPKHPLSFEKAKRGFESGKDTDLNLSRSTYYDELGLAPDSVVAYTKGRRGISAANRSTAYAKVEGGATPPTTRMWKDVVGKQTDTSKRDISIADTRDRKFGQGISLKQGEGSQTASAEPEEVRGLFQAAAKKYIQQLKRNGASKEEIEKFKTDLESNVSMYVRAQNLKINPTANKEKSNKRLSIAQSAINNLVKNYPGFDQLVDKEAASGEQKFGRGVSAQLDPESQEFQDVLTAMRLLGSKKGPKDKIDKTGLDVGEFGRIKKIIGSKKYKNNPRELRQDYLNMDRNDPKRKDYEKAFKVMTKRINISDLERGSKERIDSILSKYPTRQSLSDLLKSSPSGQATEVVRGTYIDPKTGEVISRAKTEPVSQRGELDQPITPRSGKGSSTATDDNSYLGFEKRRRGESPTRIPRSGALALRVGPAKPDVINLSQSQKALSKADRELEDANDELEVSSVPIDPDTKKPVLRQFRKNIEGHMAADPTSRTSKLNMQKRRAAELRVTNAQTNRDNAAASHDANVNAVQQAQQQQAPQETQPQQVQQPQPTQQAPVEQPPAPQEPQQPQPQQPAPQEPQQAAQQSPEDDKQRRRKEALLKRMDTAGRERGIPEYPQ